MPDEVTPAVAESSPAIRPVDENINRLKVLTPDQHYEWKLTGKLPETEPNNEESATSDQSQATASAEEQESSETDPDSEAGTEPENKGKTQPQGKSHNSFQKLKRRVTNLTGRNVSLIQEVETKDRQLQELREQLNQRSAGERPAVETKKSPAADTGEARPKADDFKTYDEYVEALSDWKTRQTLQAERAKAAKDASESEQRKVVESHMERLEEARGKYEDFDEVVGRNLPLGGNESTAQASQLFLLETDNAPDVMYAIASDPELASQLAEITNPRKAIAYLTRLSDKLAASQEETPEKESVKPVVAPLVRKKVTNAPPPPVHVGGRTATTEDEAQAALKRGDFATYKRVMNARDFARSKER